MEESSDILEAKYKEVFEEVSAQLESKYKNGITLERIEKDLEAHYFYDGLDQEGRGELKRLSIAATIAAHELFLDTHRNESK